MPSWSRAIQAAGVAATIVTAARTLCRRGNGAAGPTGGYRLGHVGIASILRSHNSTLTSCQKNIMWLSTRC